MNKLFALLTCALLCCSAAAKLPASVIVHAIDGATETFSLTDKTQFKVDGDGLTVVYPDGEYSIGYNELAKIEYAATQTGLDDLTATSDANYRIDGSKIHIQAGNSECRIAVYNIGGETLYGRTVAPNASATVALDSYKGISFLKINGVSHKIIIR